MLEKTDAFRQLVRFQRFLSVCEADFHAYFGLNPEPYLQKDRILSALSTAKSISVNALTKQGLKGQTLGKKLRQQRIEALSHLIQSS